MTSIHLIEPCIYYLFYSLQDNDLHIENDYESGEQNDDNDREAFEEV